MSIFSGTVHDDDNDDAKVVDEVDVVEDENVREVRVILPYLPLMLFLFSLLILCIDDGEGDGDDGIDPLCLT